MKLKLIYLSTLFFFMFSCNDTRSITDKISDSILSDLAKEMKKKNLIAIGSGGGCTIDKKINNISMTFQYKKVLSLNHSRELMVDSVQSLMKLINSNPDNKQYFEHFPPSVNIITISILSEPCAKDSDCVEAVSILKGKIYYDINNPIHNAAPYLTLKEETYEEALKELSKG